MTPGSSYIHTDGMSVREATNPQVLLTFVGTRSEHDPSWEVRTLPKIPTVLQYHPSTVALEPYHERSYRCSTFISPKGPNEEAERAE